MQYLILLWAVFVGPCYVALLVGLLVGRRCFPEAQPLYELTEPILFFAASVMALALAGTVMQLV